MNPTFETKQILEESDSQIFIEIEFKYGLMKKLYEVRSRMNGGNIFDDMIEKWNFNRVENELSEPQLFLSSNSNIFMKNTPTIKYLVLCCIDSPFEPTSIKLTIENENLFINNLRLASRQLNETLQNLESRE